MRPANLLHTEIGGYRIQERIGMGGMGEVYKAFHPRLNRVAAIKLLFQKDGAERFKNEAYIQSSVNHPNIARLYEYTMAGDTPCIIMEYVEGITLDAYIQRNGRVKSEETEKIIAQVAAALKYLHAKNIVHRDIKPSNFKMEKDGTVKMLDFGISKNEYTPKLTQLGFVVGTTEYMAPEQFQQKVDKPSDMWSLGVMTYELLTGHLPFSGENHIALRHQIAKGKFTDPRILVPHISEKLFDIIARCLRSNPSGRPSAAEVERLICGEPRKEKAAQSSFQVPNTPQWMYGAGALVVIAALVILFSSRSGTSSGPADPDTPRIHQDVIPVSSKQNRISIRVPTVENAIIIFDDGTTMKLPAVLTGNEGESLEFIIHAEGYEDKRASVVFSPRRSTYEYNLDKQN